MLDGPSIDPLRVEIGGGPFPAPGYVHVDADPASRHLEHLAVAWDLPFDDGSVHELLAIHVLEHVHPGLVAHTLQEWRRVLHPGGFAQIHVPNARAILPAYLEGDATKKWAAMSALYGMACDPALADPVALRAAGADAPLPDHRALYDFDLLSSLLRDAGFGSVEDCSAEVVDRHTEGWQRVHGIDELSLVVRAR